MAIQTRPVRMRLSNGTVIKVQATSLTRESDVSALKREYSFDDIRLAIEGLTETAFIAMKKARPTRASVEFGLELGLESGKLTALLVKGTGTANLKITLEWSNSIGQ